MATSTFTLPVPWRGEKERGLSGVVEVTSSDFEKEGIVEARVRDLIALSNKKLQGTYPGTSSLPVVTSLMLHGVRVSSRSLVEYLVPELMCSSPRFVSTTKTRRGSPMTIFVNTLGAKPASFYCTSMETVADVKTKTEDREGIPCKDLRLMHAGKQLRDHVTLSAYNIGNEATLQLSLRLLGGQLGGFPPRTFADVSDGSIITAIEFSPRAPEWRRCSKGLNIEGRCMNQDCRAYCQMIIDRKGFNLFNVVLDGNVKCPICRGAVSPVTCGLYDCSWRYDGVKTNDEVSMCSPWMEATGYVYHRFDADEHNGSVEWASLVLVAKPRNDPVSVNYALIETVQVSKDDLCSVCHSPFGSSAKKTTATTRCGHTFHRVCSSKWTDYCKERNMQPSCAICRRST